MENTDSNPNNDMADLSQKQSRNKEKVDKIMSGELDHNSDDEQNQQSMDRQIIDD